VCNTLRVVGRKYQFLKIYHSTEEAGFSVQKLEAIEHTDSIRQLFAC